MKGIRGIIFDCDGVLFASHAANLAYYNAVLEQMGEPPVLPHEKERAHLCHTAASPQVFAALLEPEKVPQALALATALDFRRFIPEMRPEPKMPESLAWMAARLPLAVATNRGNSMLEILAHFGLAQHFRAVVTSRDVERPKPWPDMLLLAAERLGLPMRDLLFVGDSELDLGAARAAGTQFMAYKTFFEGEKCVGGYEELVAILEGQEKRPLRIMSP